MTIETKYDIKEKVWAVVKTDKGFKIKHLPIVDMELITGSAPFIVYKLINIKQSYNEAQLYKTRQDLEDAMVAQARRIANTDRELYTGVFLEFFDGMV